MGDTYFTIGMAGHIDHGKTALTKALTNVDTDRLKEEKERSISIELGYAPLRMENGTNLAIVDVPGHERFIRQMIAGVAGIDLVILVVAADEGVMPQTLEHLEILQFLGIERCIVAISKIDRVDDEMLELVSEDIRESLSKTVFNSAPYAFVDSLSGKGINQLKKLIFDELENVPVRDAFGTFRLPVDQVFSIQGKGTIVRGTVYEGTVTQGSQLRLLPEDKKVKARQIQVHHQDVNTARAGQRTAINLGGVDKEEVKRGNVLVSTDHFLVTDTIDVSLSVVGRDFTPLKQRAPVRIHTGTSEVMGKIVFFDRNTLEATEKEVLCQIRLNEEIVVRRGDRFILRRPTPMETLGGGWIIEPQGEKYRFGKETIAMLHDKKEGTPENLIAEVLNGHQVLSRKKIIQFTTLDKETVNTVLENGLADGDLVEVTEDEYSLPKLVRQVSTMMEESVNRFHDFYPMRTGMDKAELLQTVSDQFSKDLAEYSLSVLIENGIFKKHGQFILNAFFNPHLPKQWKARMEEVITAFKADGLKVCNWEEYFKGTPINEQDRNELAYYLINTGQAYRLTNDMLVHSRAYNEVVENLKRDTGSSFDIKEAKQVLGVSRKYVIPILELLDDQGLTERIENKRKWRK
ncbi:selenocysteine-specific translation elongation factor [Virgibacillus kekensis]|uniref:Selenocysteine-specific elongation factor n=1 Tax=Virgibacillus kekensis TaxID=202261 RepID=A0ABV9DNB5_9BACI